MHPPFSFRSCRKENGPCTVQKKRTLRRVGLRRRRPPAAGGGWLAVPCSSQGRKRPALGETSSPGKFGIHPASLFAAAGRWLMRAAAWAPTQQPLRPPGECVAKRNARKETLVKYVLAPRRPPHHPPRDGSIELAEDDSVPEGGPKSEQAPIRRPPCARRAAAPECAQAAFSFGPCTARFLFRKTEKKMGGASPLDKPPCGSRDPVAAVRRPVSPAQRPLTDPPATAAWTYTAARPGPGTAPRLGWCGAGSPPPPAPGW